MPLRQAQGLMMSVFDLLELGLAVPNFSTVSRRSAKLPSISLGRLPTGPLHVVIDSTGLKVFGAGQWLTAKHGPYHHLWGCLGHADTVRHGLLRQNLLPCLAAAQVCNDGSVFVPQPDLSVLPVTPCVGTPSRPACRRGLSGAPDLRWRRARTVARQCQTRWHRP